MKYIGIDYGTKKTGVAFSDDAGQMGFPHGTLITTPRLPEELAALIKEKGAEAIVMGESRNFSGNDNPVAEDARKLGDELAKLAGIPVHFEPETYTTQEARRYPDGSRMEGSPDVDASAAALILTGFFEREASKPQAPVYISIDDFAKVHVAIGTVLSAERVPETDKLLRLMVDLGEAEPRQIVSGINAYVESPESLVGRQLSFVTNLAPRKIKGLESNGMLFAVGQDDTFAFVTPDRQVPPGTAAH
ncbi:MAG: methionyl-tRNA synthetase/methionyl-tRNA synthetase C-terminal region/beta chain [Parcubacteria group bacterium]|nr:methionyl-tRNA synthetase/methionyl-tRNA synthetase C-terminal region/beta chain [Parcubacteria group bacterium]